MLRIRLAVALLLAMLCPLIRAADPLPPIPRLFPPVGIKPDEATARKLRSLVEELERDLNPFDPRGKDDDASKKLDSTLFADVAIYPKAVRYALDYDEFYKPSEITDAEKLLTIGRARLKELQDGVKEPSWTKQRGLVVRGYISVIDDSVQPYGLHIPEDLDLSKKPPLYIWLHGRQEKTLDLQFINERAKNKGKFAADDAITVHPFGRYNNAFKFAGERDVLDVMFHVERLYQTDPARRVLMGFSMGGAGCWHIGAHYPHLFCAMAPGAGFVESRKFLRLKDDALPPWYEQILWQWYDVPNYTRNLFNLPVIAYSGEKDGQKQAADVMEAEFAKHGKKLNHIIGPNMGHDYDKASLEKIRAELKEITGKATETSRVLSIQTPLARYGQIQGISLEELNESWHEARLDTSKVGDTYSTVKVTTKNIKGVSLFFNWINPEYRRQPIANFKIDHTVFQRQFFPDSFKLRNDRWLASGSWPLESIEVKYQGSIDAAFCEPFIFVVSSGQCRSTQRQAWVEREMAYQIDRWRRTFRGDPIVVRDKDLTKDHKAYCNLVLWGDDQSNTAIHALYTNAKATPVDGWKELTERKLLDNEILTGIGVKRAFGELKSRLSDYELMQGFHDGQWFALNSGPTFRDEHDRNNANQTPKLPDWAVIDVTVPGDAKSPGRVVAAGFFDNDWKYVDPAKQQKEMGY